MKTHILSTTIAGCRCAYRVVLSQGQPLPRAHFGARADDPRLYLSEVFPSVGFHAECFVLAGLWPTSYIPYSSPGVLPAAQRDNMTITPQKSKNRSCMRYCHGLRNIRAVHYPIFIKNR